MKCLVIFLLIASLGGCATGYHAKGLAGGFNESRLQSDQFRVSFKGNGFTDDDTVENYMLLRCAEITLENGFDYFVILEGKSLTTVSTETTPTIVQAQSSSYGTANYSGQVYGNTLEGTGRYSGQSNGTAVISGGNTYQVIKPGSSCLIRCFKGQKPKDLPNGYQAYELIGYLKNKAK